MYHIMDAGTDDIPIIQDIAEKTWWPTYSTIISDQQIRYMLGTIYSSETLTEVMRNGSQKFIFVQDHDHFQGFAAYGARAENDRIFKLHKLYVLPGNQGKGYGRFLIGEVKQRASNSGCHSLDLNVNRQNPAKRFYEKLGFTVIGEEDIPIGPYWMNDYVMRLQL
jgi:diamine N-acetyltransferase